MADPYAQFATSADPYASFASAPPPPSVVGDVAKSAATGLGKGVAAVIGLPGDIANLADRGMDYITGSDVASHPPPGRITSADVNRVISAPTGGYHVPQTTAGKYAETIASFAPAAVAPGGIAARVARVAIPGAASEAAGEATQGTAAEPYARMIGALAGGAATGIGESALTANQATKGIATTAQIKNAATQSYKDADNAGLIVNGDSMKAMGADLKQKMAEEGIDATLHPKATAVVNRIINSNDNTTLKGIDILRQQAGDVAGSADKAERRLGRMIKDHIDDYVGNLQPGDVVQGDAPGAADSITNARALWATGSKAEIIDNAIQKAGANSGLYTVAGDENALRTQFRKLANNDRVMRRFSPDERAAITQVATGTNVGNAMRYLGKLAPRGVISGAPTYEAFEQGGPVAALGVAAAGELGRVGARASTVRSARLASELVRSKAPPLTSIHRPALGKPPTPVLTQQSVLPYVATLTAAANAQNQ